MKKCSRCKAEKDFKDFYKASRTRDGLMSHCKECQKKSASAYYKQNRDVVSKKAKAKYKKKMSEKWEEMWLEAEKQRSKLPKGSE